MADEKKIRLTGIDHDIARMKKRSDDLTAKIEKLTKRRDGYDKSRAALVDSQTEGK